MRLTLLSLMICFRWSITIAQVIPFSWAKVCVSTGFMDGKVAIDSQGNVISAGSFDGTVDFDPGPGISNQTSTIGGALYLLKLDSGGNFLWVKTMSGDSFCNTSAISLDATDNIYLAGNYYGTLDFDPGSAVFNLTAVAYADAFVLKLDADGNFAWVKSLDRKSVV